MPPKFNTEHDVRLRGSVAKLLHTQQALINLRHRRDREQKALAGITRLSGLALPNSSPQSSFWQNATQIALENFDPEYCLAIEQSKQNPVTLLSCCGPKSLLPNELQPLALHIREAIQSNTFLFDNPSQLQIDSKPLGTLILGLIGPSNPDNWRALLAAVSLEKKVFFETFDQFSLPGIKTYADHLHVVWETLQARNHIASQLAELDHSNAALSESEKRYRHLFEGSAEGMALVDTSSQSIIDCNQALCHMANQSHHDMVGRPLNHILATKGQDRLEGGLIVRESEILKSNGQPVPVEVRVSKIQLSHASCQLCVFQDLTHRREAEKEQDKLRSQLLQSSKMESVGRLAGGVAHDFNNLLTVIQGHAELLHEDANLHEAQKDQIQEILQAADRARSLTQQLLMFSRKQVISPVPLDMNEQVESSLRIYRRLIGEDIQLKFSPTPRPTPVLADRAQLDQIIVNLLINARDAIHASAKLPRPALLHVSTRLLQTTSGPHVQLTVADSGIGIDPDTIEHIFEPFFTTKAVGKGTGLGLATVHGVIQQNDGYITVESVPGQGTSFHVYWPIHKDQFNQDDPIPSANMSTKSAGKVILVEDDDMVRKLTVMTLQKLGFEVTALASAKEAIDLAKHNDLKPNILITDVVMPEMNGRELAEAFSSSHPDLPVLFVSGYSEDILAHHGVLKEGINLLQKPFSASDLASRIHELISPPNHSVKEK
jgi:two-component system cell cycle sensor histidine kinase/response regulator CckA